MLHINTICPICREMRLRLWSPHQSSTIPMITTPTRALPQATLKDHQRANIRPTPSLSTPHNPNSIIQHNHTLDIRHTLIPVTPPTPNHDTPLNPIHDTQRRPTPDTQVTLTD